MKIPLKRVNKTKPEILDDLQRKAKAEKEKSLARRIFPHIQNEASIYDAQTVVQALAGFIDYDLMRKEQALKLVDLDIDFSKEKNEQMKNDMTALMEELKDENAKELSLFLQKFGSALSQFSAIKFMKNSMDEIKIEDFIA